MHFGARTVYCVLNFSHILFYLRDLFQYRIWNGLYVVVEYSMTYQGECLPRLRPEAFLGLILHE